jgi:hypothetical protein
MKYMNLDQRGSVQAEYVWIDAIGGCRSKTKVCINYFTVSCRMIYVLWENYGLGALDCVAHRRKEIVVVILTSFC